MDNSSGDGGKSGASPSPDLQGARLDLASQESGLLDSTFAELAASSPFPTSSHLMKPSPLTLCLQSMSTVVPGPGCCLSP